MHLAALALLLPLGSTEVLQITPTTTPIPPSFGGAIALFGDTLVVGTNRDRTFGPSAGAAYIYERDLGGPGAWGEHTKIFASDATQHQDFGNAVALDGDTLVVGAYWGDPFGLSDAGAVYVFERDLGGAGNWGERIKLTASDVSAGANFGQSVALQGGTLIVGADELDHSGFSDAGAVYVFERDLGGANAWGEAVQVLSSEFQDSDKFGRAVAFDAGTLLVGSYHSGLSGAVHVFGRDEGGAGQWGLVEVLFASDPLVRDNFGQSVGICGDTAVVGASGDTLGLVGDGAAYVFERDEGGPDNWGEVTVLEAADQEVWDYFGSRVAIDGDRVLVSAPFDDIAGVVDAGAAYLFDRNEAGPDRWGEFAKLTAAVTSEEDHVGGTLAIEGTTVMSGAWGLESVLVFDAEFTLAENYCTAGTSASGCRAFVRAGGLASATAPSGFVLSVANMEGAKDGLFFYGTLGRQANPWGSGTSYVCVVPPRVRGGLLTGVGSTAGACDGFLSQDLNARWCPSCPRPAHNPGSGAVVQAQMWYRDPQSTSNQTSSMSDAIEFTVGP